MNLKDIQIIKSNLKDILNNKEVLDVIVFGSFVKGKINPNDIDIAIIFRNSNIKLKAIDKFHFSIISIEDFFIKHLSLINTLLREGYSVKYDKYFSELFKFENKVLFSYELTNFNNSTKVKLVNMLHGKNQKGLVEINGGVWVSRQVFITPIITETLFEDIFKNFNCKYKKSYILIH